MFLIVCIMVFMSTNTDFLSIFRYQIHNAYGLHTIGIIQHYAFDYEYILIICIRYYLLVCICRLLTQEIPDKGYI